MKLSKEQVRVAERATSVRQLGRSAWGDRGPAVLPAEEAEGGTAEGREGGSAPRRAVRASAERRSRHNRRRSRDAGTSDAVWAIL